MTPPPPHSTLVPHGLAPSSPEKGHLLLELRSHHYFAKVLKGKRFTAIPRFFKNLGGNLMDLIVAHDAAGEPVILTSVAETSSNDNLPSLSWS